jgi:hypothetical protein
MLFGDRDFTQVRPRISGATEDTEQLTVTVYRYEPDTTGRPTRTRRTR